MLRTGYVSRDTVIVSKHAAAQMRKVMRERPERKLSGEARRGVCVDYVLPMRERCVTRISLVFKLHCYLGGLKRKKKESKKAD